MDDGLQHFSFARHFDGLVLNSSSLSQAPFLSFPMGPYREGFSKSFFTNFLGKVHFRFWSRNKDFKKEKNKIAQVLKELKLSPNVKQDILICYKSFLSQTPCQDSNHSLKSLKTSKKCIFISGTAMPESIVEDLKPLLAPETEILKSFYRDHGEIPRKDLKAIKEKGYNIITTYKDFWRWEKIREFQELVKVKKVFLIELKLSLYDIYHSAFNFLRALNLKSNKYRKNVACLVKYKNSFLGFKNPRFKERQCPQGGIEPYDKSPRIALTREIKEELGLNPKQYKIRYESSIWRYYDFPNAIKGRVSRTFYGQVQLWFLIEINDISFLEKMTSDEFEGYETLSLKELISQYISWKRIPLETFVEELYDEKILTN
jgi:8-oxo-dGTP pyrophosphatase MutT (NUDIX family)